MMTADERIFEWVFEGLNDQGEMVDTFFETSLPAAMNHASDDYRRHNIALIRAVVRTTDGSIKSVTYAYLKNGSLPSNFDDGSSIPDAFVRELVRTIQ